MNMFNKLKKGQGLPLNTIVLAILVIIVLLIIVVFFTTKMAQGGKDVESAKDGFTQCEVGTILIPESKYSYAEEIDDTMKCNQDTEDRIYGGSYTDGKICCATVIN